MKNSLFKVESGCVINMKNVLYVLVKETKPEEFRLKFVTRDRYEVTTNRTWKTEHEADMFIDELFGFGL